jgi:hypothetical protein
MESAVRPWPQEIDPDIFMLIYERDKNPIYVEFLLHYRPYQGRVGIFAYPMFAIIVGFNIKRHAQPLWWKPEPGDPVARTPDRQEKTTSRSSKTFSAVAFPLIHMLTNYQGLSKPGNFSPRLYYTTFSILLSAF